MENRNINMSNFKLFLQAMLGSVLLLIASWNFLGLFFSYMRGEVFTAYLIGKGILSSILLFYGMYLNFDFKRKSGRIVYYG